MGAKQPRRSEKTFSFGTIAAFSLNMTIKKGKSIEIIYSFDFTMETWLKYALIRQPNISPKMFAS